MGYDAVMNWGLRWFCDRFWAQYVMCCMALYRPPRIAILREGEMDQSNATAPEFRLNGRFAVNAPTVMV